MLRVLRGSLTPLPLGLLAALAAHPHVFVRHSAFSVQYFPVNDTELPPNASARLIASGQHLHEIYATNDLDEEQDFDPVIDALPGDGPFQPLWRQILIHFNPGVTPRQFVSADEVEDAALAGDITLEETDEIYRCAVVGAK